MALFVLLILLSSNSKPPIAPAVLVTLPIILAADAVICPFDFNTKSPSESLIWVEVIEKSAILPPVNNTSEPVICPPDFKTNLSLELDIAFDVKAKEAISPVPFTVNVPPIDVLPLISVLPLNKAFEADMLPLGVTAKLEDDMK